MSETAENPPQPQDGSALLRQARERSGVHVAALAVALKVPVRQLEALEQGRFDLLPDHTFARALAASVCRHLKVDPAPILAALPQGVPRAVSVNVGINEPFRSSTPVGGLSWRERLVRPPVVAAVLLLLAALALIVIPEIQGQGEPALVPADAVQPAVPAAPAASDRLVVEPVTPLLLPSSPPAPASAAAPAPGPAVPAASQPAAPAARQP